MAASPVKSVGGYSCEFIDPVSDDFICKVCNCVASEPNLTICCGQHYCQSCITKLVEDRKPCQNPECGEAMFSAFLDKNYHRKILALRVYCTIKDRGCQWTGKLEQLNTHLDVNSGDCQYVDVECPEKCGQQVQKHQLATHITNNCPKRVFSCMYCGLKATYEVVSEQHWPECQNYPIPCPNRCQIGAVERNTLEDHLNMCPLGVVECDFSYAGCNEKLQRQDMEKHIEENTQKHLALMASVSMKMSREFKQKLQEQRDEFQGYLEQKDGQIKVVEEQLQKLVRKEEQIESMRKSLQREQKEGEQQLQQQLEQKERQIKHVQESLQEQLEEKDNQVQGELHGKQKEIEALKEQIIQGKQDHKEQIEALKEQIESMRKSLQREQKEGEQQLQQQLEQKERQIKHVQESLQEQLQEKDNQVQGELRGKQKEIEALKEQIIQGKQDHKEQIEALKEQIESMRKSLQREQKEGEQQLQQQLEQKERQIKHVQESLQEQLQEKDNQVQGELRRKQKQMEALEKQIIQVKQDHEEQIKKQEEKDNQVQGELHEKQQQIEALKEQIVQVKRDHEERIKVIEQQREEQIKSLEVQSQQQVERIGKLEKQLKEMEQELELQLNMKLGVPPFHLTIYKFNCLKTSGSRWVSPSMYTHTHGYRFCIVIYPNGNNTIASWWRGEVYHVSVYLYSMPGEFDATLQWPAKFTITLQLLNQRRDQNHITVTTQFLWSRSQFTECVGSFTEKLIAHTNLQLNAQKQTHYLKDGCLHFCITKIEAQK